MNPYFQVIIWAAGIVLLFVVLIAWNNHKWKKIQRNRIRRIFGKVPEREYSPDDLERISHYFRRKKVPIFVLMILHGTIWIWTVFSCR